MLVTVGEGVEDKAGSALAVAGDRSTVAGDKATVVGDRSAVAGDGATRTGLAGAHATKTKAAQINDAPLCRHPEVFPAQTRLSQSVMPPGF
jgi:hypothetical protein